MSLLHLHWFSRSSSSCRASSKSYEVYRCCTPNASMCPTANGSGRELEKPLNAPPSIAITAPEDVPDAGLRSLDHCRYSLRIRSIFADIVVLVDILKIVFSCHDKRDYRFGKSKSPFINRCLNPQISGSYSYNHSPVSLLHRASANHVSQTSADFQNGDIICDRDFYP